MCCLGELNSLRAQSVGEVSGYKLVMCAVFRMCGNESQPGLQLVEQLATPLASGWSICFSLFHEIGM